MKTARTQVEVVQIQSMIQQNPTFYRVFNDDWTKEVMGDLRYKLNGKIPRNFLVNFGGLIGSVTGIFKSTLGLQVAFDLDGSFNIKQRVAFSINQLLEKVRNNTEYTFCNKCFAGFEKEYKFSYEVHEQKSQTKCQNCENLADKLILYTKLIFFLDEQTRTLKSGGIIRLQNLVDTCRQRQICFITCGVGQYGMHFTTYDLKRVQESSDEYLPKKRVRYAVYDNDRDLYYGYFQWDITPLTDPTWKKIFDEYSILKTDFQRVAISQQTQSANFEQYAQDIINGSEFSKTFKTLRDGRKVMQTSLLRSVVTQKYPDLVDQDRENIIAEIKMQMMDEDDGEEDEEY